MSEHRANAIDHASRAVVNTKKHLARVKPHEKHPEARIALPSIEYALNLWVPILAALELHRDLEAKLATLGHAVISLKDIQAFVAGDRTALDKYIGDPQYSGA